eukprot:2975552-Rhodomonas_salina.1
MYRRGGDVGGEGREREQLTRQCLPGQSMSPASWPTGTGSLWVDELTSRRRSGRWGERSQASRTPCSSSASSSRSRAPTSAHSPTPRGRVSVRCGRPGTCERPLRQRQTRAGRRASCRPAPSTPRRRTAGASSPTAHPASSATRAHRPARPRALGTADRRCSSACAGMA